MNSYSYILLERIVALKQLINIYQKGSIFFARLTGELTEDITYASKRGGGRATINAAKMKEIIREYYQ